MLDNQQIQNNWPRIKTQVLNHWNKLSEVEVENTHGNVNSLGKLIEGTYGAKEDFDAEYERLCLAIIRKSPKNSVNKITTNDKVADKFMDKDRDDQYLMGPNSVTRPLSSESMRDISKNTLGENGFNPAKSDGFNNVDRHSKDNSAGASGLNSSLESEKNEHKKYQTSNKPTPDEITPNQAPGPKSLDITEKRSNSFANTTSHSALKSSGVMSKDTKKL